MQVLVTSPPRPPPERANGVQAEYPAEHPGGTWRPTGLQGPFVCHGLLIRKPCTASENTGEAIGK
jgi:hypothetical protein